MNIVIIRAHTAAFAVVAATGVIAYVDGLEVHTMHWDTTVVV